MNTRKRNNIWAIFTTAVFWLFCGVSLKLFVAYNDLSFLIFSVVLAIQGFGVILIEYKRDIPSNTKYHKYRQLIRQLRSDNR